MGEMISHVVLMKPKPGLPDEERRAFIAAFERALREITTVRAVRIGRRVVFGASYESTAGDAADYLAIIDFEDLTGLQTYLQHPAHEQLGALFYRTLSSGLAYDFEVGGLEMIERG
jgi:hypothetical protein